MGCGYLPEMGCTRVRGSRAGRSGEIRVGGRMVSVQKRIGGRLRHGGVGGCASVFQRKGWYVRWLLRRRDAVSRRDCQSASSVGNFPGCYGVQLSRRLDLSGRRVRAMVRRIMDDGTGGKHHGTPRAIGRRSTRLDPKAAVVVLSRARSTFGGGTGSLFHRLAGASEL